MERDEKGHFKKKIEVVEPVTHTMPYGGDKKEPEVKEPVEAVTISLVPEVNEEGFNVA